MARKLDKREIWLLSLLVAFLAWFLWNQSKSMVGGGKTGNDEGEAALVPVAPIVMLASLEDSLVDIVDRERDLFAFGVPPVEKKRDDARVKRVKDAQEAARKAQQQAQNRPPPTPRQPPKARAPKPSFQYIGNIGPKDSKFAVFTEGQDVLVANVGDEIKNGFVLMDIGFESVVIGYTEERYRNETTELQLPKERRR